MHGLETLVRLNELACLPRHSHWRLKRLRHSVDCLPVVGRYRIELIQNIGRYADQFISRPSYKPDEGWDDLEALQQATLGDAIERQLRLWWIAEQKKAQQGDCDDDQL